MKMKLFATILSTFAIVGLAGCSEGGKVEFDYVHLQNNSTGFKTEDGDTAIAIGLKKGSPLKDQMNEYLSTLTTDYWTELMTDMAHLAVDKNMKYSPAYTFGDGSNGTLKVGMECAYEPFNWTQDTGDNGGISISNVPGKYANGYDVQIAAQVAAHLNMKLEIYQYEWEALLPAVQSGTITAIAAGMSPTEERLKEIDFSANYYQSNLVVIGKKGSKIMDFKSLTELDQEGIRIAAQPGTFHLEALQEQTKKLTVVSNLTDFVAMRIALEAGTIDGYVAEEPTAITFCAE